MAQDVPFSLSANERAIALTVLQRLGSRYLELIVPVSDGIQEVFTFLSRLIKVEQTVHQREVVRVCCLSGERCLHIFLTEQFLDKASYVPGKVA